jgi:XRE family aerobic/anaerobic benzoate catabolism transcriptional regulator
MEDLKTILAGRSAFYGKAHVQVNTSEQPLAETFGLLRAAVRTQLALPE